MSFARAGALFMAPAGFLAATLHPCPKRHGEHVNILLTPTPPSSPQMRYEGFSSFSVMAIVASHLEQGRGSLPCSKCEATTTSVVF